jgi:DNA polymerase-3 subunit beta
MQVTLNREELLKSLSVVSKALPVRTTLPVLECILFVLNGTELILTASNSDLTITTSIDSLVSLTEEPEYGGHSIPGKIFVETVKRMKGENITISTVENQEAVLLKSGRSKFTIQTLPENHYPEITSVTWQREFELLPREIEFLSQYTMRQYAKNEARPVTMGIQWHSLGDGKLNLNATDGFRVGRASIKLEVPELSIIVPAKAMEELGKMASVKDSDSIGVKITSNYIKFEGNGISLQSRLIEGAFPDVLRFLPSTFTERFSVDTEELLGAIDIASIVVDSSNKRSTVRLHINQQNNMNISSSNGSNISDLDVEIASAHNHTGLLTHVDGEFLSQAIKSFESAGDLLMSFNGAARPFVVTQEGVDAVQLLVPIKRD